jgi:multimeric flavodoxin WrbA
MKIVAIDATPRCGVVSRSVDTAAQAAEAAGAEVHVVRLRELEIRECTGCLVCKGNGVCKIRDDLPALAAELADADAVIFGTPSYFLHASGATKAVLSRLSGYFGAPVSGRQDPAATRTGTAAPSRASTRTPGRAVIITSCAVPEPLATFLGYSTAPVREFRRALGRGGIRTIGSLAVTDTWRRPGVHEWERDKARSLGRVLAGKI